MANPYIVDNQVKVSVILPCDRQTAWTYIGTAEGYSRWFPAECQGEFATGKMIKKSWWWVPDDISTHQILAYQPPESIEYSWEVAKGGRVRYSIEGGRPTIVHIEATYPKTAEGREAQLLDVAPWTFAILNLKSVASGGIDLRHHGPKPIAGPPFID